MKWGRLKGLTNMILSGDTMFPEEEEKALALLEYAFESVAIKADTQKLIMIDPTDEELQSNVVRVNAEGNFVRRPVLPKSDNDELDIDDGLVFALARLMASFLSAEKFKYHYQVSDSIIQKYNEHMESINEYNQSR